MELKDVNWELLEHFREEAEKSTVTFEKQDCKNETSKVEHTIIPDFWSRTRKVNFLPKKSIVTHPGPTYGQPRRNDDRVEM